MLKIRQNLPILITKLGLNVNSFANSIGQNASTLRFIINGKTEFPNTEIVAAICDKYNVSADWLLFGKGEPEPDATPTPFDEAYETYVEVMRNEYFAARTELEAARQVIESQKETIELLKSNLGLETKLNPKKDLSKQGKKTDAVRKGRVMQLNTNLAADLQQSGLFVAL